MSKSRLIDEAMDALRALQVGKDQLNERSAMTLLALLHLEEGVSWSTATNPMLGTRAIMDWIRDKFGVEYKPNTRETIRRFTLHQFVITGIVEENADQPDRPINSPKWNYRVTNDALKLFKRYGGGTVLELHFAEFLDKHPSFQSLTEERQNMPKTPVIMPSGSSIELSPSGQSVLIKSIVEEMLPRFAPSCNVIFIDDTDHKHGIVDTMLADKLNITLQAREKAPDVIAWDSKRDWLFLVEAASTHGPIDITRKIELHHLFANQWDKVVLISCFPNRRIMQKYLSLLAWETEAWCSDSPDHMVHLNGSRFMGPYGKFNP
ncbi:MAG: BsuBI/PstI family type II restriction endonuclease [Scardovia wiggsiae]